LYLDAAYLAKVYLNEPESRAIRELITKDPSPCTSSLSVAEVCSVFHRRFREGLDGADLFQERSARFLDHVHEGVWTLIPVSDRILRRTAELFRALPREVFLRAGDAIHLAAALDNGEREIWTNDRRLLAAAPRFGIRGRSV
jgi:predicted nucleic acid-binding protein